MPRHPEATRVNWLVHRLLWDAVGTALRRHACGILLDIGCGVKPYRHLTAGLVKRHFGLDGLHTQHDRSHVDLFATAYATALSDASVDTVLCTFVLEHLDRPQDAVGEIRRILKPGGYALVTAPLFWHLHEEPRDFFRYTAHGFTHLLHSTGLEVVELLPLSGFLVTFLQETCYYLAESSCPLIRIASRPLVPLFQFLALSFHRLGWDTDRRFTWAYLVVARRPSAA